MSGVKINLHEHTLYLPRDAPKILKIEAPRVMRVESISVGGTEYPVDPHQVITPDDNVAVAFDSFTNVPRLVVTPKDVPPPTPTVPDILRAAAATFEERNKGYGSNYKMVAPMVKILFPGGVPPELVVTHRWHLFELMLVKLSRFAISGLSHQDSIRDLTVYAAMVESLLEE